MIAAHKNKPIKDSVFFIRPSRGLQSLEESMSPLKIGMTMPKSLVVQWLISVPFSRSGFWPVWWVFLNPYALEVKDAVKVWSTIKVSSPRQYLLWGRKPIIMIIRIRLSVKEIMLNHWQLSILWHSWRRADNMSLRYHFWKCVVSCFQKPSHDVIP